MIRGTWWLAMGLCLATVVGTAIVYPSLPDRIPIHWNIDDVADGFGSKVWAFLVPGMALGLVALFGVLPWLSPKPFSLDSFRATYARIVVIVLLILVYVQIVTLWAALGHPVAMGRALVGGICLCLAMLGNLMGKVRRNLYVGIRTPWTLASDHVWNATHRLSARLFVVAGLLGFGLAVAGAHALVALLPLVPAIVVPIVYSWVIHNRWERGAASPREESGESSE